LCVNEAITWQAYFLLQEGGTLDPARPIQQTQQHTQQQQQQQQQQLTTATAAGAKPSTGTISGMLADFSKALGLYCTSVLLIRFLLSVVHRPYDLSNIA
jgi:hypothetical protein